MGRKRNYRNHKHKKNNEFTQKVSIKTEVFGDWEPACPVCGKPVKNLNIAIEEKKSKEPAHFECVMQELSNELELGPQERLHYLGSGCFGVIKLQEGKGLAAVEVLRRIQYEDSDKKSDWRKKFFYRVNNCRY